MLTGNNNEEKNLELPDSGGYDRLRRCWPLPRRRESP